MKYIALICMVSLVVLGCKKKHSDSVTTTDNFAFTGTSDSLVTVTPYVTVTFPFNIKVLAGDITQNHLTCLITGLPANVTVSPDSLEVAQLLGGVFMFNTTNITPGSYPIQLVIKSKSHGTETHNIILKANPSPDFAPTLAGTYATSYDFCQPTEFYHYSSVVSTVTDTPYLLKMTNIRNLGTGFVVRAWVSNVVTIPLQTIGSQTIWGTGTYSHDGRPGHTTDYLMAINDTMATGTDTTFCTIHIEH
jgi:hypothetical protein